jgi:hypothetical protein
MTERIAVVVTNTRWAESPRMRHYVTLQLKRWFKVIFVEYFPYEHNQTDEEIRVDDNLFIYSPRLPLVFGPRVIANIPLVHWLVNKIAAKKILKRLEKYDHNKLFLFNFVYDFYEIVDNKKFCYSSYFCFDEFPKMQRRSHRRNRIKTLYHAWLFQQYENSVISRVNECYTPHFPLRDKILRYNMNVHMFYHAHDNTLYNSSIIKESNVSSVIKVGFAGYVNYRILTNWLLSVIADDQLELNIIGPQDGLDVIHTFGTHRMKYGGQLSGVEYFQWLHNMDVLIMPYDWSIPEVRILTTNSKIFQYISVGKPIVISDLPNYLEMPEGVFYKAKDENDFIEKIKKSVNEDCLMYRQTRVTISDQNTWDSRGLQIYENVSAYF